MKDGKAVKGRWKLDERHRLAYSSGESDEEFTLDTSLVAAEPDALVLSVTEKQESGIISTSIIKLSGTWKANDDNQLEFDVTRQFGKTDTLTFKGAWKVGESNELIYTYRKKYLKTKTTELETLTFKGYWDISERHRLTYTIEGSSDASFRFRGAFQTPSVLAKKGELRWQLGMEVDSSIVQTSRGKRTFKRRKQVVTLFGTWKLSDRLELSFEMEYADGVRHEIRFGAEFTISEGFTVAAKLMSRKGDPVGVEVVLTKEFLEGNAQAFVRLKKTLSESAVEGGVTIPW